IAKAFDVDSDDVQNAWFLESDYGMVAKVAKEKGADGLRKIKVELGIPIMPLLAVKASSLEEALKDAVEPALEYKYDGMRMQCHKKGNKIWIFTRRQENVTNAFPDLVELCKSSIKADECIIEGEVLAINNKTKKPMPFQKLSQRIKRKYDIQEMIKEIPIQVNLFDIVYLNGKLIFDMKLKDRRALLEKNIKETKGKFQLSEMLITKDLVKADKFYKEALKAGQEGVMVKNLEANYQPERHVGYWWKVKPILETLDLVVIGGTWGTGKRAGWIGSYVLGCRDPETGKFLECGMLGSGLKEKKTEKEDITMDDLTKLLKPFIEHEKENEIKIKPKVVIEVAYEEIQKSPTYSSGFALRFPRVVRIRFDKGPEEADSIERFKKIYDMQKGKK
ncbi:MAG: ATP-dependent DNA ligase, partial [Candidatus Aenigmarchaeota archaeon]|nr:ATP-dependent DNA ligase [Candidatus Aenigmarchaeota archaeon]